MRDIRWVIQSNLISEDDYNRMSEICKEIGVESEGITVIPFSPVIPDFTNDEKTNIYYGSTTLMYNLYHQRNKPVGLFFDEDTFTMENYLNRYKEHMLTSDGKITTFKEFSVENHSGDSLWFMRPNADDKSFNGVVKTFSEAKNFIQNSIKYDNVILTEDTKILVGSPWNIEKEWRNYIVDGRVITSSLYQKNFRLKKDGNDIPQDMINFVEDRCKEYVPHAIFAMDIALCGGEYYIIECGCLNSVGLYHSDVKKMIVAVTNWIKNN